MTFQRLQAMLAERPFKPFRIHSSDGEVVTVNSPEFTWIHPSKRVVMVATDPKLDTEEIIDLLRITKLSRGNGKISRSR